jgi:hypothetical protein
MRISWSILLSHRRPFLSERVLAAVGTLLCNSTRFNAIAKRERTILSASPSSSFSPEMEPSFRWNSDEISRATSARFCASMRKLRVISEYNPENVILSVQLAVQRSPRRSQIRELRRLRGEADANDGVSSRVFKRRSSGARRGGVSKQSVESDIRPWPIPWHCN